MFGKSSEKVRKRFGKGSEISEIRNFRIFQKLRKNDVTRNSKITKNLFRLENRLESSVKSSECRALKYKSQIFFYPKFHNYVKSVYVEGNCGNDWKVSSIDYAFAEKKFKMLNVKC
jgi:hypothetical protein